MPDDLISRLEKAKDGSRELDEAIRKDVDAPIICMAMVGPGAPYYTASIDAALTLVPARVYWQVGDRGPEIAPDKGVAVVDDFAAYAATPILALCIAALRLRASDPSVCGDSDD